ncbi:LOW QUALITY PROTEIN: hypothetical protein OSB04_001890 [Centaurea solstitialis]|uniref:RNase III domain-containing protein n=1 Tax=Centaurea solstitialis TaxID=347529 RepID=A0AA38WUM8_9ASTR|nr:LOW QUALITY PROTEIN: hypothetical protein OSB04_001890 [Centaurea solstitialis]
MMKIACCHHLRVEIKKLAEYTFQNRAFSYQSYTLDESYEMLEYLGDSILHHGFAKLHCHEYQKMTSQEFTDQRSANVLNERLARVALKHGLYNLLLHKEPGLEAHVIFHVQRFNLSILCNNTKGFSDIYLSLSRFKSLRNKSKSIQTSFICSRRRRYLSKLPNHLSMHFLKTQMNLLERLGSKFLRCNMGPVIICADLNSDFYMSLNGCYNRLSLLKTYSFILGLKIKFKTRGNERPYKIRAKYVPQGEGEEWLVECNINDEVYGRWTYQEHRVARNLAAFEAYNTLLAKDGGDSRASNEILLAHIAVQISANSEKLPCHHNFDKICSSTNHIITQQNRKLHRYIKLVREDYNQTITKDLPPKPNENGAMIKTKTTTVPTTATVCKAQIET